MDYKEFVLESANWVEYNYFENMLRASIGFHAEYKEYLQNNSLDELGDCLFWWTVLVNIFGYEVNNDKSLIDTDIILDRVEKLTRVGLSEISDEKLNRYLDQISLELGKFPSLILDLEKLQTSNRAKLEKRGTV